MSSQYGPHGLGYTRTTRTATMGGAGVSPSQTPKVVSVRIVLCKREREAGIASNRGSSRPGEFSTDLVHTARHAVGIGAGRRRFPTVGAAHRWSAATATVAVGRYRPSPIRGLRRSRNMVAVGEPAAGS
jgi:hypothetical protein